VQGRCPYGKDAKIESTVSSRPAQPCRRLLAPVFSEVRIKCCLPRAGEAKDSRRPQRVFSVTGDPKTHSALFVLFHLIDDLLDKNDADVHATGDIGKELGDEIVDGRSGDRGGVTRG
jgi:hypothetical protein